MSLSKGTLNLAPLARNMAPPALDSWLNEEVLVGESPRLVTSIFTPLGRWRRLISRGRVRVYGP